MYSESAVSLVNRSLYTKHNDKFMTIFLHKQVFLQKKGEKQKYA